MPVQVLLPTTGSLNQVLRIEATGYLTASQVIRTADWMPLDISRRYHAMTVRDGLLRRLGAPFRPGLYRLWLKLPIESGNSWELPVILAQFVVDLGYELAETPAKGDIVLWATGAVDGKLDICACDDYHLPAKIAYSRTGLRAAAAAGAPIIALVPACESAAEDAALLRGLLNETGARDAIVEIVDSVRGACGIVDQALGRTRTAGMARNAKAIAARDGWKRWTLAPATALVFAVFIVNSVNVEVPGPAVRQPTIIERGVKTNPPADSEATNPINAKPATPGETEHSLGEALRSEVLRPRHPYTLSLENLAQIYAAQGRYGDAEPLLRDALRVRREVLGPRHPDTLTSLNNLAELYVAQGRYGDAEPLLQEALQARREVLGPRHPGTLTSLSSIAVLYYSQGRYVEAEPLLQEALQTRREVLGPRHPDTLTSLNSLADLYRAQGRYGDAERLVREALQGSRAMLGPRHPRTLERQVNAAAILVNLDRHGEAVRILQEAEPNLLGWIGQELYSTEAGTARRQMASSQEALQATFQDAVLSLALADQSADASWLAATVMLRFKLMQGEEEAYVARLVRRSQNPRVQTLASDIGKLRQTLADATRRTPDAFEKTLQTLEGKRRELIDASPEYKSRLQVLQANADDVRKALPADAVLVEFRQFRPFDFRTEKLGEPRFAGLLLTSAGEPVVADLGPVLEVQSLVRSLTTATGGAPVADRGVKPDGKPGAESADQFIDFGPTQDDPSEVKFLAEAHIDSAGMRSAPNDQAAAMLYDRLFAPFRDALASAKAVYVAPDGILDLVAFARLELPDGSYWAERQEVRVLQTGRDLLRPEADHPARGILALGGIDFGAAPSGTEPQDSVFTVAGSDRKSAVTGAAETFRRGFNPLPATADEVIDVTEWYRMLHADEPTEIWSGAAASKARLMALKTPPRILHLATHGFYLPNQSREPMLLSGIALAGANREVAGSGKDGLLFALEAEGLKLDGTELVVLSACDTAQGDVDYSEGVFGLARALRTAGARNVLVTLWPIQDGHGRDFMVDFYKHWLIQPRSDPAKALRETQLEWIKTSGRDDPRFWAPYVVIE
jgi:CHAT domain-containing protein/tetratricopeptide (TPR) repeat protein